MKNYWKVIGIGALVVGILYYPALKLYQYIKKQNDDKLSDGNDVRVKMFSPAYRGKHKPHHRHAGNGDANLA